MSTTTRRRNSTTRRRNSTIPHQQRWAAAIDDCRNSLGQSRLASSTLDRIAKHLLRFADDVATPPFDVTPRQVARWLEGLTCGESGRYAYRTSLRTFYRWAYRAGRITTDPTTDDGPHPLARPTPEGWTDGLRDFRRWLAAANYSDTTIELYSYRLSALARQTGASTPWQLTSDDLAEWLGGHRWARETIRSNRTIVRTFFGWAHEVGHLDHNPADRLPKVRPSNPRPRPASDAAYRSALALADERTTLMLRLSAELGLRRAEVAQLHALDLEHDELGYWLTVHGKGDRPRRLPVTRELAAAIRQRGPGYLFPGRVQGHLSPARVGKLVAAVLPEGVSMHALRHRFATRAYAVDRDVFTVQQLLGHASPETTQRYVQTDAAAMRRLVDLVA